MSGDYTPPSLSQTLGGGRRALLVGRAILLGQGCGLFGLGGSSLDGDIEVMGGGGGLSVGLAALNTARRLLYPCVGMLGHGVLALIRNVATEQAVGARTMAAGERVLLEGGGWVADLGLGLQQQFWGGDGGGMTLGYQMGLWIPLTESGWVENGDAVGGLEKAPPSFCPRLHVGGGSARRPALQTAQAAPARQSQAAIQQSPPMGVIMPSFRFDVSAMA